MKELTYEKLIFFLKQIWSFIFPIILKSYNAEYHRKLIVKLVEGKIVLDTEKNNYSYGSLQKILKKGLQEIGFDKNIKNILVLGLGGGSVIETIRKDFKSGAYMTIIDIDPLIIKIAKEEFKINRFSNIDIIQSDASEYVKNCSEKFDLIIVDIFIEDIVPEIFTKELFISEISNILNENGKIIYNTMRKTFSLEKLEEIQSLFIKNGVKSRIIQKVCLSNNLILGERD